MKDAQYKYEVGMKNFVSKPCHSWFEFVSPTIAKSIIKTGFVNEFSSIC
jgi:phytoene desaturase